jgi:uncharacterized small protein (DUF1192 family)
MSDRADNVDEMYEEVPEENQKIFELPHSNNESKRLLESKETSNHLSLKDKYLLDVAKLNRRISLLQAEKALAEHTAAEANFKYSILQLYMKYGLTEADAIDDDGQIHKNVKPANKE